MLIVHQIDRRDVKRRRLLDSHLNPDLSKYQQSKPAKAAEPTLSTVVTVVVFVALALMTGLAVSHSRDTSAGPNDWITTPTR